MLNTFMEIGILIVGFVLLIKGADFFVDGSSSVAKRLKVPSMIIGLTIVAMGTSLPECAVSVTASMSNNNALAVSNVVGSNLFNLMVVCGVCTLFVPLAVSTDTLKKDTTESIPVGKLGKFKVKDVPERTGKIMLGERAGETYVTPAHQEITFKMSKSAKQL